ncbi:GIY-YIG nuclease family protein [Kamptonema cortianum]|uniref:GIY-YIG nuclease family protein n=1 Tax=Geitlerinema calcuttense NRMC-F 0142 TaxID=2922238 RepID=A0ABT7LX51_9CYAN|nr:MULTISPECIES: GIY-YIG nuclease family protein [Cyanophyceae]MDK3156631.1 GIY-YIG nuclease family protein [Kamptonema cortianum]MDL5050358.1 GIY-YIG nuclease family protein [Oscillatoria amoena NRMC-F 0135]MDL5053370.1 GIY-YIG nuclease family protein [Oscillatoria laete-virens NRMC-F 0139]MDL5056589.1 GIY-YIG nuclease family protein [Geitlerinema calcuttense NRMC-F 0142]
MPTATLKIFLSYGDPKRLRTAELSNWNGKAVSGPRSEFEKIIERDESRGSGVYFLSGIDPETNKSAIYIGEAECIRERIKSHLSKDFWNNITFFVTKDENLTKAHVKYLEGRLIEIARSSERAIVINNQSSGAKLPESDREDMEVFLEKIQQVLPVLGVDAFIDKSSMVLNNQHERELLYCKIKGLIATGYLTPNGIVVLKGSQAVLKERDSAHKWPSVLTQRNKLIEENALVEKENSYVFVKDVEFSSSSTAAAVIHGGSANGLISWTNNEGVSLKNLQSVS